MMLGTVEKNRVDEYKKKIAEPRPLSRKQTNLVTKFLKNKLSDSKKDNFDDDEKDLKKNLHKYDIFEEKDYIRMSSEGASTDRRMGFSQQDDDQVEKSGGEEIKTSKEGSLESNSIHNETSEKSLSMRKLMGYYKDKVEPEPETFHDYCFEEDEFYPSVLNE